MELVDIPAKKLDDALRTKLSASSADDIVRAVLLLGDNDSGELENTGPSPEQFGSRQDYRKAMIAHRQSLMSLISQPIVSLLQSFGLTTFGASMTPTLIVEGRVRDLIKALREPAVKHASLDQEVSLTRTEKQPKR